MTQQASQLSEGDVRTASEQAQIRIAELEKIVVKERARADVAYSAHRMAEARVAELRAALDQVTDDDAMTDIVQDALVDLGVKTRLDTGESMREFCNSVAGEIIDAMRIRFAAARAALAARAGEPQEGVQ
jgi:CHASE3 domain sensor protein